MSDELLALAKRCEEAGGPDRELDERLFGVLYGWTWPLLGASSAEYEQVGSPSYTALIDAALTLVPEGWNWMAGNRNQPVARAYVENGAPSFTGIGQRQNPDRVWHEVVAATPALALCSAALRALATQPTDQVQP